MFVKFERDKLENLIFQTLAFPRAKGYFEGAMKLILPDGSNLESDRFTSFWVKNPRTGAVMEIVTKFKLLNQNQKDYIRWGYKIVAPKDEKSERH